MVLWLGLVAIAASLVSLGINLHTWRRQQRLRRRLGKR